MRMNDRTWAQQRGFSFPELMIAMAVLLIVMAAVLSQVGTAFQVSSATYEMTEAQQGLRFAHEYLNRDLLSAGDGLRGINNIRVRRAFVLNFLTTAPVLPASDPGYMTLPLVASDNDVAGTTPVNGVTTPTSVLGQTDRITLLLVDSTFAPLSLPDTAIDIAGSQLALTPAQFAAGNFQVGEVYFINSSYGATFAAITSIDNPGGGNPTLNFGNADPYSMNLTGNSGAVRFVARGVYDAADPDGQPVQTSLMRMQIVHYFVNAEGALVRRVFGARGAGHVDSTVAEHVSNLQFRYFLDGATQPVAQLTSTPQQVAVRQVEATVSVQTAHAVVNGQRQGVSSTAITSVRNLQFRQAL